MATELFVPTDGAGAAALISASTGAIDFQPTFFSTSGAALNSDGLFALCTDAIGNVPLQIWQWNGGLVFTLQGTFAAGLIGGGAVNPAAVGANFWALTGLNGLNSATPSWYKFTAAGTVLATIGPITAFPSGVQGVCVSLDETIGYYCASTDNAPIKRWDLVNNVALSNLVANLGDPDTSVSQLYPVAGSTDIVACLVKWTGGVDGGTRILWRLTAAGATVYRVTVATVVGTTSDITLETGIDPSFDSVWFRYPAAPDYDMTVASRQTRVSLLNGSTVSFVDTTVVAGVPATTCPFLALGASAPTSTLTVRKVIDPVGDVTTAFPFTTTGGLSPSAFTLVGGASRVFSGVPAGTYGVEEVPPVGWLLESVVVSSGDPAGAIVLAGGNAVTVTFTNKIIKLPVPGLLLTGKMHVYGYAAQPGSTLGLAPGSRVDIFNENAPHHQGLGVKVESSQPLGNPFVADKNGYYSAYVVPEPIDLQSAGDGVDPPERYSDVLVLDPRIQSLQNSLLAIQQSMATLVAGASGQVNQVRNIATGLSLGGSLTVGVR